MAPHTLSLVKSQIVEPAPAVPMDANSEPRPADSLPVEASPVECLPVESVEAPPGLPVEPVEAPPSLAVESVEAPPAKRAKIGATEVQPCELSQVFRGARTISDSDEDSISCAQTSTRTPGATGF